MLLGDLQFSYRSFEDAELRNLGPINVLVGPNNAGKSSVFELFREFQSRSSSSFEGLSVPNFSLPDTRLALEFPLADVGGLSDALRPYATSAVLRLELATRSLREYVIFKGGRIPDFMGSAPEREGGYFILDAATRYPPGSGQTPALRTHLGLDEFHARLSGPFKEGFFFLSHARGGATASPCRKYDKLDPEARDLAGRLDHLLTEREPEFRDALDRFVNSVVPGLGRVAIQRQEHTPQSLATVVFDSGDRRIALDSLGGGVEQTLTIATVLLAEPTANIVCLEEPESHMHEAAQRRLLRQIEAHRNDKQIFIATHSPVFMNGFADARIYHVSKADDRSTVQVCIGSAGQRQALNDLGLLPSTLLQTNCVVWVEGPTERILVRHWLSLLDQELEEHEHYEFIMTAGTLLGHITADEDDKKTQMLKVCRSAFAICDRDDGASASAAKIAVRKIAQDLGEAGTWVTHDYEIEWYFPKSVVHAIWAKAEVDTLYIPANRDKPFYEALLESSPDAGVKTAERRKVAYATQAVALDVGADEWFGVGRDNELALAVRKLATRVREANQLADAEPATCETCGHPLGTHL